MTTIAFGATEFADRVPGMVRTWGRDLNRAAWDLYLTNVREKGDQIPGEASFIVICQGRLGWRNCER